MWYYIPAYTKYLLFAINEGGTMIEIMNSLDDDNKQPSIMVPMGDLDVAEHNPDVVDELALELATIKQPAKRIAIIGSRNLAITHQQMIETLATALVMQGNTIITSGGSCGTNAAAIRGAMKSNPDKLKAVLSIHFCAQVNITSDILSKSAVPPLFNERNVSMITRSSSETTQSRSFWHLI